MEIVELRSGVRLAYIPGARNVSWAICGAALDGSTFLPGLNLIGASEASQAGGLGKVKQSAAVADLKLSIKAVSYGTSQEKFLSSTCFQNVPPRCQSMLNKG